MRDSMVVEGFAELSSHVRMLPYRRRRFLTFIPLFLAVVSRTLFQDNRSDNNSPHRVSVLIRNGAERSGCNREIGAVIATTRLLRGSLMATSNNPLISWGVASLILSWLCLGETNPAKAQMSEVECARMLDVRGP
jgi:hypothetical protein